MDLLGINTIKKQDITVNLNTVQLVEVKKMLEELVEGYTVGAKQKGDRWVRADEQVYPRA